MADHKGNLKKFCDEVIKNLETVFINTVKSIKGSIVNRNKLWRKRKFLLLRSSTSYEQKWAAFLGPILTEKSFTALFYQRITDVLFWLMLKSHYQIANNSKPTVPLNDQEANALRYAAGFVCCHLRKKIEKSTHKLKEELIVCLMTLVKDVQHPESTGSNEEWLDSVD